MCRARGKGHIAGCRKAIRFVLLVPVCVASLLAASGVLAQTGTASPARRLHEAWREPVVSTDDAVRLTQAPPANPGEPGARQPSAQAVWIPGYWDYDASTSRFAWVSGTWRVPPPGRTWVQGTWARDDRGWYRVPGFWTADPTSPYRAEGPSAERPHEPRGPRPSSRHLWVAGHHAPQGETLVWKPGFWSKHQPGWTWIPATWLERPRGWVFQDGYWLNDDELRAATEQVLGGRTVTRLTHTSPSQLGGPVTDTAKLLRDWANENATATGPPVGRSIGGAMIPGMVGPTENHVFVQPWPGGLDPYGTAANSTTSNGSAGGRGNYWAPSRGYYVGNDAPGTTFRSYELQPSGSPSRSVYAGSTAPGTAYGSYSLSPSGTPGGSYYTGNNVPGTTYRSYLPSTVDSVGNYGYGTTAPGNTAGQVGGGTP